MTEALSISTRDMKGPVLRHLGRVHIKQQKRIFATEGAAGATGRWAPRELSYAKRKKKLFGRAKILQLSGDMKRRFTMLRSGHYYQEYIPSGEGIGRLLFGAYSNVAAAHLYGNPALAPRGIGPTRARAIFGGQAPRLPVRNLIAKSAAQVAELRRAIVDWYRTKRIPQVMRHYGKLLRASKPGGG